jgi:selenocysteine-specific elongation factor
MVAAMGWTNEVFARVAAEATQQGSVVDAGGVYLGREDFAQLSSEVVAELDRHHKREPLARGMLRETLREKLFARALPEVFSAVIGRLEVKGEVTSEKDVLRLSSHRVDLTDQDAKLSAQIEKVYLDAGVEAPSLDEAMTRAHVAPAQRAQARKILQLLIDGRKLMRVHGDMFMHAKAIEDLKKKLQDHAAQHEPDRLIDVPTFKNLAGVSRKYAIPLLEYFDREQLTRRAGDKRLILRPKEAQKPQS